MKKIILLLLFISITHSFYSQSTSIWSSDSEKKNDFQRINVDGDRHNWKTTENILDEIGTNLEKLGFNSGIAFYSESFTFDGDEDLTPDNLLITPSISIPNDALSISFKMKVAVDGNPYSEEFTVYVYDEAVVPSFDGTSYTNVISIYNETLAGGNNNNAKDITVPIPVNLAGKNIRVVVRHNGTSAQSIIIVDDFDVSYSTSLSVEDNQFKSVKAYPNPVQDKITIDSNLIIDSAVIFNKLGQQVKVINNSAIIDNRIDLSLLDKGVYFLTLKSGIKQSNTLKIIKQ